LPQEQVVTEAVESAVSIRDKVVAAGRYTPVPNWVLDNLLGSNMIPPTFLRFMLFLWRETVGWNRSFYRYSNRDIADKTGITKNDASRFSRAVHAVGWFDYQPGEAGRTKSGYTVFPNGVPTEKELARALWVFNHVFHDEARLKFEDGKDSRSRFTAEELGRRIREIYDDPSRQPW
jgi:hypothetical protein